MVKSRRDGTKLTGVFPEVRALIALIAAFAPEHDRHARERPRDDQLARASPLDRLAEHGLVLVVTRLEHLDAHRQGGPLQLAGVDGQGRDLHGEAAGGVGAAG